MHPPAQRLSTVDLAEAIREVFAYLHRFRGRTFVLKIEDYLLEHPFFPLLMKDVVQLYDVGIRIVIVPGTRKTIAKLLQTYGIEAQFHNGVRLTTEETMPIVKLAAMEVTQQILAHLTAHGATGVSGNWVRARSLGVIKGVDYVLTGKVERVRADAINQLLAQEFIPIVANLGWNKLGQIYNVSSNEVTSALCTGLEVAKVFYIGLDDGISPEKLDLPPGVATNRLGVITAMDLQQAHYLEEHNRETLPFGTLDTLQHAIRSCEAGAERVHLVNGISEGSILQEVFSSQGDGTMIFANDYSVIRAATVDDVPSLLKLMDTYMRDEVLVPRTAEDLESRIDDFLIYQVDESIHACGALHPKGDGWAEVAAIAVDTSLTSRGVGRKLVEALFTRASERGLTNLYLLTTQAADWFARLGFVAGRLEDLPENVRRSYNTARNSKVMVRPVQETDRS
jgi:amino-acid N-acetyltransferase